MFRRSRLPIGERHDVSAEVCDICAQTNTSSERASFVRLVCRPGRTDSLLQGLRGAQFQMSVRKDITETGWKIR